MTGTASAITDVFVLAEPLRSGCARSEQLCSDVELVPPVDLFERTDRALQLGGALAEYALMQPVPVTLLPNDAHEIAARLNAAAAGVPQTAAVHRHRTPVGLRYHVFVRFADADAARAAMGGAGSLDEARLAGAPTRR